MNPEERRDAALARISEAGGRVTEITALAHPDDPTVITAYRIHAVSDTLATALALAEVREDTEFELSGLVAWQPSFPDEDLEMLDA